MNRFFRRLSLLLCVLLLLITALSGCSASPAAPSGPSTPQTPTAEDEALRRHALMGSFAEYGFQKTGRRQASAGFCWLHRVVGPYARWRSFIRLQLMKPYRSFTKKATKQTTTERYRVSARLASTHSAISTISLLA